MKINNALELKEVIRAVVRRKGHEPVKSLEEHVQIFYQIIKFQQKMSSPRDQLAHLMRDR